MDSKRISWLLIIFGVALIVLPPIFAQGLLENGFPLLILALSLIFFGVWRLAYEAFLKPRARLRSPRHEQHSDAITVNQTATAPQHLNEEDSLFDTDPLLVKQAIDLKLQRAVSDLFDVDPELVRTALAAVWQQKLGALFDADPEIIKQEIANRLEHEVVELFDIDPQLVHAAIALRNESELGELFDTDPEVLKAAIAQLIQGVLFDLEPEEFKHSLAKLSDRQLWELFDAEPELLRATLRLHFASSVLELFDKDPAELRATFAWRQNGLKELFDADPEALRALWHRHHSETESYNDSSLSVAGALQAREDLLHSLTERAERHLRRLTAAERDRFRSEAIPNASKQRTSENDYDNLFSGKIGIEVLKRLAVERIVEDKLRLLEIKRRATAGILAESKLSTALKKQLLNELTLRLSDAKMHAQRLRLEAKKLQAQERQKIETPPITKPRRPRGELDPELAAKLRQRMLERSRSSKNS